jgi:hypothetical protein
MRIISGAFLVALLLSIASSSISCRAQTTSSRETSATLHQAEGEKDSSTPAGWKRYDFDKPLSFSLILPSEPERRKSAIAGGEETAHVYISKSDSGVYGVTYIDNLRAVASRSEESGNEFFFNMFVKDFAMKLQSVGQQKGDDWQFKVIDDKQITVNGFDGLERNFSIGDFRGRVQLVRAGQAGFCVVAIWEQTAPSAERDAFFKSVKIVSEVN